MTRTKTCFLFFRRICKLSQALTAVFIVFSTLSVQPAWAAPSEWLNLDTSNETDRYTINFNDVAATEFINFVRRISNKNFIYDASQLNFKITIVSDEPASSDEILSMLIQIMRLNNLQVTEEGSNLLIYKGDEKNPQSNLSQVLDDNQKTASGLVTRVFRLRYASVKLVQEVVSKLATDSSRVAIHEPTRHLIVSDMMSNVERIGQLITALDQIDSQQEIEVYKVKHANLSALKSFAEQVIKPLNTSEAITLIPNMGGNSLFIIGSRQGIDRTLNVLTVLDVPSELEIISKAREKKSPTGQLSFSHADVLDNHINPEFFIYKLQFHRGEVIMKSLQEISTNMAALAKDQPLDPKLINSMQTIQWLETTNSLIFSGDDATIIKLKNLIQSLDTPVKQVFIEALIIDASISKASEFKVDVASMFTWKEGRLGVALGNLSSNSSLGSDVRSNYGAKSYQPPQSSPSDFSLGVIGSAISHNGINYGTMGALLKAVQSDSDTRIILNPKIITEDNIPCEFFVGQQTRVKTGTVQNSGNNNVTSSNFEIMDVGTLLKIVPTVSNDELISLVVEQESSTSMDTGSASDTTALVPLMRTSRTKTRLHVPDRHFVILSGMIDENVTDSRSKVPILGDIPIVGFLFRAKEKSRSRRNLLFFIRPHIIRTPEEADMVTQRHKDIIVKRKLLSDEFDEQVGLIKNLPNH